MTSRTQLDARVVEHQRILKKPQVERHTFLGAGPRNSIVAGQAEACHWQTWEKSMRTTPPLNTAERFGRWLGRGWRSYARGEGRVVEWLAAQGVPSELVRGILWLTKLVIVAAILYCGVWVAAVCFGVVSAAWVARNLHLEEPEAEWRLGQSGYGLYRGETRIDIGDAFQDD